MTKKFLANGLPVLIGSLPLRDHAEGVELVFKYTPEVPLWIQLPAYREEGMVAQFQPGFPGLTLKTDERPHCPRKAHPARLSSTHLPHLLMMISLIFTKIIWLSARENQA